MVVTPVAHPVVAHPVVAAPAVVDSEAVAQLWDQDKFSLYLCPKVDSLHHAYMEQFHPGNGDHQTYSAEKGQAEKSQA
jgi:hypothetical protein